MSWLIRLSFLSLLPVGAVAIAAVDAQAQTLPNMGVVEFIPNRALLVQADNDAELEVPDAEDKDRFFNFAHCVCSQSDSFPARDFGFEIKVSNDLGQSVGGQFWVANEGVTCTNSESRDGTGDDCVNTGLPVSDLDQLVDRPTEFRLRINQLVNLSGTECKADVDTTRRVWLLASSTGGSGGGLDYGQSYPYEIDTKPPVVPSGVTASAVEGTATIAWTQPAGDEAPDYYQALCATTTGEPLAKAEKRRFDTAQSLCGVGQGPALDLEEKAIEGTGASVTTATFPPDFLTDPKFVCADTVKGGKITIKGLAEGTDYVIAVVGVDEAGNADGFYLNKTVRSIAVTDAWEDLNDDDKYEVEGGFCLINQTYGGGSGPAQGLRAFRDETLATTAFGRWLIARYYAHVAPLGELVAGSPILRVIAAVVLLPAVALALAWHLLTLPGLLAVLALAWAWRRRRRRQPRRNRLVIASAATAALVAVPAVASAQSSIAPYWEEEGLDEDLEAAQPRWNVGVKIGPYTPGIDAQYQDQTGTGFTPFEDAFLGGMWLPVLEVDYFILSHIGQLGIGVSGGFTGDGARPWKTGTVLGEDKREREPAEDMKFRMVPLTLTAVYRATQLDELYGVPLIPYARAGLAYYIWWMRSPNGEFAQIGDCESTTCKGRGGSFGLVGSVGLALRAENIDKSAALSMRESGIEHAGFYVEGSLGWVDGFGNEKRMALGDLTWFGGFNFEF
jgi:hypothetical protein